ncbi:hypothetical protein B9Z39_12420 [Limnohabitans sp. JirII-29]|uniref:DUF2127 domain-containing protein n=1 Tax=unclassified Limnohabitans TaxID=2626134 RepID=UPI000C1F4C18|nr:MULTISPECIES: DUF2127 domain-containing protein [unclassified Limnohabitans]PIT79266.1 hypothetical protein B9Z41_07635 [Limnohabitans sp. JirII-31]PUE25471.1 hypothetical protein B9Z39_12420 [Limnohabitans sp. JirII-29]
MTQETRQRSALHAIAFFEATKGLAASAGLIGVLDLLHQDVRAVVMALIGRFGLDPEAHYPSLLLHYAELLPNADVHMLVALGLAYIALRFLEAAGLWLGKAWGEYLGALSGGVYIPFELIHLIHEPSVLNLSVVLVNVLIVGYLTHALWQRHQQRVRP